MTGPKQYDEYKASGIEWVGPIPVGWETRPLFAVARENTASNKAGGEPNLLSLSYGRIVRKDIAANDGLLPASFDTYQVISRNDIVLRLTDLQNDKRSLRSAISQERGIITSAYLAVTPTRILPNFLSYLLRAYDLQKVFYAMGGGLRQSMKFSDMKWLPVVVPPEPVQELITEYLDRETAQIDDLIGKQERLIELLAEKRQALITHALTKGLDPSTPMKPSGVPWLGEIPAHWALIGSRRIFRERGERARLDDEQLTSSQRHGIVSQSQYVAMTGNRVTSVIKGEEILKHVEPNDFVISMRSFQGGLELSHVRGKISSAYVMLVPHQSIAVDYFRWLFKCDRYISGLQSTSNLVRDGQALRFANFAQLRLPVPPLQEQKAIASWVEAKLAAIDKLQRPVLRSLDLLRERRSALISAVVTGKINVTIEGAAA